MTAEIYFQAPPAWAIGCSGARAIGCSGPPELRGAVAAAALDLVLEAEEQGRVLACSRETLLAVKARAACRLRAALDLALALAAAVDPRA